MTIDQNKTLHQKYEEERLKRLRSEGLKQYERLDLKSDVNRYDPFSKLSPREAKTDHVDFAFIGGGFSGLVTCARARMAGLKDIRIIDRAGDFGGTWYWNRYPGVQCDTASLVYMPLLEETNYLPSEKYAHGPEIFAHCQRIGRHYNLYDKALFHTEVTHLTWAEDSACWRIRTDRGDNFTAKYVGLGIGELHIPKIPANLGADSFKGHSFHAGRWDYQYTGGNAFGAAMSGLSEKRVGIVGTGATAVQCIPEVARSAMQLFVFQRTPSSVFPRNNSLVDGRRFQALVEPGWQQLWLDNFAANRSGHCPDLDLVEDGWTAIARLACAKVRTSGDNLNSENLAAAEEQVDADYMEHVRTHIDNVVVERSTADSLKPWYRLFCKRPCFNDNYLPAFNNPNVHLVDTNGKGIDQIVENGVLAGGKLFELDCLIFATGFEAWTPYVERLGFDPVGSKGIPLSQHWHDGPRTLHGIHIHGFPNLFIVDPNQGGTLFSNATNNIVASASAIADVIRFSELGQFRKVDVLSEAESTWVEKIFNGGRVLGSQSCTPGRYNYEGQDLGRVARLNGGYPEGAAAFFDHLNRWRTANIFEGLNFH